MENIEQIDSRGEERKPKRVFVEIGTGTLPLPRSGKREFGEDEIYVGIDIDWHNLAEGKGKTEQSHHDTKEKYFFVNADAKELPLRGESADEIFFRNVFGDPSITKSDKLHFLKEARRILVSGGTLVVKETSTPLDRNILTAILGESGFNIEKAIDETSGYFSARVKHEREFLRPDQWSHPYIIFAKKLP